MEDEKKMERNKGGRPLKHEKMSQVITFKCSVNERKLIGDQAHKAGMPLSKYLRSIGLTGKIIVKKIPPDVMNFLVIVAGLGNNFNQLTRKRNHPDGLTAMDVANLRMLIKEAKEIFYLIKSLLK